MANKLSDWLPLLTHPEVGERIVEAAGVDVEVWGVLFRFAGVDVPVYADEEPPQWALAALAFGTLEVLADNGFTWPELKNGVISSRPTGSSRQCASEEPSPAWFSTGIFWPPV